MVLEPDDGATQSTRTAAEPATEDWSGPPTETDRAPEPVLAAGTRVGRYRVTEAIGRGGMGVVYRARDPELGRDVALKLVRIKADRDENPALARARLLREAQSLARLSHPNVVAVHDAGAYEDHVFLAMELVEGDHLARWLSRETPKLSEILRVFIAAGRGLAAAHAAGIVHRDFKPRNVILGRDGRVRVLDFGLAKPVSLDGADEPMPSTASTDDTDDSLTRIGTIVGTPKYMALEQMTAASVDERSDQFSFCVALWEAVYGERPFAGKTMNRLAQAVRNHELRDPPRGSKVPRWLRQLLARGLAASPDDRHPSMTELLDALERTPRRRRRIARAAVALVAIAAVAGGAAALTGDEPAGDPCADPALTLGAAWDDDRRAAIADAFRQTGRDGAARSFDRFAASIGTYADRWAALQRQACVAARDGGAVSPRMYDLQLACLDRRRSELDQLTALYTGELAPDDIDRAVAAAAELGGLDRCRPEQQLAGDVPPPRPEIAGEVRSLRSQLDRASALRTAGRYADALALVGDIEPRARELGYAPLLAEVLLLRGQLYEESGDHGSAYDSFADAARVAAGTDDAATEASAWNAILWVTGYDQRQKEKAEVARVAAEVALARAGSPPALTAGLVNTNATIAYVAGDYATAGDGFERVLAMRRELYGAGDYQLAGTLSNLGLVAARQGDYARAIELHEQALAMREQALGPDHPEVAIALNNLGIALERSGELDRALAQYQRALAIREDRFGSGHASLGGLINNIGAIFLRRDQPTQAVRQFERALAIKEAAHGPDHPRVTTSLDNLAEALLAQNDPAAALPHIERSLAISLEHDGPDHPERAYALTSLGRALLALGRARDAIEPLERAVALRADGATGDLTAESRFALARAYLATGRRARAIATARQARADVQDGELAASIDAWLAAPEP